MVRDNDKKQQSFLSSVVEFLFLLIVVFLIRTFVFGLYQVPTGSMETTMLVGERFFSDKFSYNFRKPRIGEIIAMNDPEFNYSKNPLVCLFQRYVWGPQNWTKRVIGIPGDTIKGCIEDGKPVVYRNGVKLDEGYLNKYPLIRSWRKDPNDIYRSIESDWRKVSRGRNLDSVAAEKYFSQQLSKELNNPRSYDPSKPYDQQEFYRLNAKRIYLDEEGNPDLIYPNTPLPSASSALTPDDTRNNWNRSDVFFIKLGSDEYWCMGDNRLGSHDCRVFGPIKEKHIHGRIIFCIWSIDSDESWWILDLIKNPIDFWKRVRFNRCLNIMK